MGTFSRNRASCVLRTFVTPSRIASNWSSICAHDEIARRKQLTAGDRMFIKKSPGESKEPDAAVVARAQAGDADALETLFASWRKPLFAFVYRMVTRREDAEDLTQEVFLRCLRGLAGFRGESQFRTWLFGIATHVCLDHLREKQRWRVEAQMRFVFCCWEFRFGRRLRKDRRNQDQR